MVRKTMDVEESGGWPTSAIRQNEKQIPWAAPYLAVFGPDQDHESFEYKRERFCS
jgi:hypothetical protein